jgi:hypothetical protein
MCRAAYPYLLIEPLLGLLFCLIVDALTGHPFFGGHSEEAPPVPIPNTAVKLFCADGTAWATVWESRSPPNLFIPSPQARSSPGALAFELVLVV